MVTLRHRVVLSQLRLRHRLLNKDEVECEEASLVRRFLSSAYFCVEIRNFDMRTVIIVLTAIFYLGIVPDAAHAGAKKPFTATTVQTVPNVGEQRGKIFVSDQGMRFEFRENNRDVVQIVVPQKRLMRILFPAEKSYMEVHAPKDQPIATPDDISPCPPIPGMTCKKLGADKFGDMDVERWQQTLTGVPGVSTVWWEPGRKMVVRQEYPDGRIKQLNLGGEVDFYGRKAERWDISYARPNRPVVTAQRLVDTDLGVIVSEQDPSGMTRELQDLRVVDTDPAWFRVPDGYQRIEPLKSNAPVQQ